MRLVALYISHREFMVQRKVERLVEIIIVVLGYIYIYIWCIYREMKRKCRELLIMFLNFKQYDAGTKKYLFKVFVE